MSGKFLVIPVLMRRQEDGDLSEVGVHVAEWEHSINDAECWQMLDPLRERFYELRRHYDLWAVVAVISEIDGTATCRNRTSTDLARRNLRAWRAEDQGFESL
jgi:hypothetical protein